MKSQGLDERVRQRWQELAVRPMRGRLAGLSAYRPYRAPAWQAARESIERTNRTLRGGRSRAERVETLVVAMLLEGRSCRDSVDALREITGSGTEPVRWTTWNNLSAALLACAPQQPAALGDELEALEAASRALALSPRSEEALFNRALALEVLHLPSRAAKAWQDYLEVDSRSPWAEEARSSLDRLESGSTAWTDGREATGGGERSSVDATPLHELFEALQRAESPPQSEIRTLIEQADQSGLPALAAAAWRLLAYRTSLDGRFLPALDFYQEAAQRFDALADRDEAAVIRIMRAEILAALGRREEALAEVAAALPAAPGMFPWQRYSAYWVAANTVAPFAPAAAEALWREAADVCPEMPERPLCAVDARIRLASRMSDRELAAAELAAAERELARHADSPDKYRTELDIAMAEAAWLLAGREAADEDLAAAIELYGRAVEGYEILRSPASLARARAARARTFARRGEPDAARTELLASLTSLRRWDLDARFRPEAAETGPPAALREIYEDLIRLHLANGGAAASREALLLSDEMRDRLAPRLDRSFEPLTAEDLDRAAAGLPADTAAVELLMLSPDRSQPARAVAWILVAGRWQQVELPCGAREVAARLEEVRGAAAAEDLAGWQRATAEVRRLLLSPVEAALPVGVRRLLIVPDSELYGVPFRGLWDPAGGRYLDEDFTVSLAPSLRQLTEDAAVNEARDAGGPVLAVGFEDFSALGLFDLDRAIEEEAAVLSVYGESEEHACPVVDWPSLRRCLPGAGVVHLAAHAAADSRRDGWSWLALPGETVSLARLWRELPPLPRRPLVVLSACESVATAQGGEGLGGLARPFLARGARTVVGTLWPIADGDAAEIFPLFHRAYRDSGDAAWALGVARKSWQGWRERPWAWSTLEVIQTGT